MQSSESMMSVEEAAIRGYQARLVEIEKAMAQIRQKLGRHVGAWALARALEGGRERVPRRHRISKEGRERIAAAQRARWAKAKREKRAS